ncbi:NADPH-dependent FMN reductase [Alkalicoccus saliphilus]|uniref:NADPH-dependent FMN reductase n=1 Tax=Alkalicoccus saliphilus TaxID=200989 RepID=A0A2T4U262_9BACI|nr:NAD(P)H-dependent oxidoreductase [Alkalicoccus saliphilus]PTL37477.1 NADPH-dependent FMN reductase [Alkalicoccus saliphilus]
MKIVMIVGSIRKESYNQQVADFMTKRFKDKMTIEQLDIKSLPFFNQDEEEDPPETVKIFKNKIKEADGVLVVTPEYNHSVPGMLKNAIDWVSRGDRVMTGKPVMIVGATPGFLGTVRCQIHLRQIMAAPGVGGRVLPGNEVLIGGVNKKLDGEGGMTDTATVDFLDTVTDNFVKFVEA